jgi:hypothetical protein
MGHPVQSIDDAMPERDPYWTSLDGCRPAPKLPQFDRTNQLKISGWHADRF